MLSIIRPTGVTSNSVSEKRHRVAAHNKEETSREIDENKDKHSQKYKALSWGHQTVKWLVFLGEILAIPIECYSISVGIKFCALPSLIQLVMMAAVCIDCFIKWVMPVTHDGSLFHEQQCLDIEKSYLRAPGSSQQCSQKVADCAQKFYDHLLEKQDQIAKCWQAHEEMSNGHHVMMPDYLSKEGRILVLALQRNHCNRIKDCAALKEELRKIGEKFSQKCKSSLEEDGILLKALCVKLSKVTIKKVIEPLCIGDNSEIRNPYILTYMVEDIAELVELIKVYQTELYNELEGRDASRARRQKAVLWSLLKFYEYREMPKKSKQQYQKEFGNRKRKDHILGAALCIGLGVVIVVAHVGIMRSVPFAFLCMGIVLVAPLVALAFYTQMNAHDKQMIGNGIAGSDNLGSTVHTIYRCCLGFSGIAASCNGLLFYGKLGLQYASQGFRQLGVIPWSIFSLLGIASVYRSFLCTNHAMVEICNRNIRKQLYYTNQGQCEPVKKTQLFRKASVQIFTAVLNMALIARLCSTLGLVTAVTQSTALGVLVACSLSAVHYLEQSHKYNYIVKNTQYWCMTSSWSLYTRHASKKSEMDGRKTSMVKEKTLQRRRSC